MVTTIAFTNAPTIEALKLEPSLDGPSLGDMSVAPASFEAAGVAAESPFAAPASPAGVEAESPFEGGSSSAADAIPTMANKTSAKMAN
ncbi:hypothetical protein Lser_V15G10682 [Lactuca serriola]